MRPPDILVEVEDTGADGDVFSGTEIDQPKSNGIGIYFAASTVNTATVEVPQAGHDPGKTSLLQLRANGIPDINAQVGFKIPIRAGARPVISLGGTTGTVHHLLAVYYNRR